MFMTKAKKLLLMTVLYAMAGVGCNKDVIPSAAIRRSTPTTAATSGAATTLYFTSAGKGMYLVELISLDNNHVFTSLVSTSEKVAGLRIPAGLGSGHYDVVVTPEGLGAGLTTYNTIGGVMGSASKYPATIKNAAICMGNKDSVSIRLN
jgi:hypothetical protein